MIYILHLFERRIGRGRNEEEERNRRERESPICWFILQKLAAVGGGSGQSQELPIQSESCIEQQGPKVLKLSPTALWLDMSRKLDWQQRKPMQAVRYEMQESQAMSTATPDTCTALMILVLKKYAMK